MVWTIFLRRQNPSQVWFPLTKNVVYLFYKLGFTSLKHGRGYPLQRKGKFPLILGFMHVTVTSHSRLCQIPKIWGSHIWGVVGIPSIPKTHRKGHTKILASWLVSGHIENFFKRPRTTRIQSEVVEISKTIPDLPVPQIFGTNLPVTNISTNWTLSSKYRELEDQGYLNHKYGPAELHLVNSSGPEWKKIEHFRSVIYI